MQAPPPQGTGHSQSHTGICWISPVLVIICCMTCMVCPVAACACCPCPACTICSCWPSPTCMVTGWLWNKQAQGLVLLLLICKHRDREGSSKQHEKHREPREGQPSLKPKHAQKCIKNVAHKEHLTCHFISRHRVTHSRFYHEDNARLFRYCA